MGWVVLFPGQGAQKVGMTKAWWDNYRQETEEIMGKASEICGVDLLRLTLEGPEEELNLTFNAQPAILATSLLTWQLWQKEFSLAVDAVAGHSLGEYSALCAAESIDFEEAIFLVRKRGELMQEAVPPGEGAMVAVLGLSQEKVENVVGEFFSQGKVEIANINSSSEIVLSLSRSLLPQVVDKLEKEGSKKVVELKVSAPFHSSFMKEAAEKFSSFLEEIEIKPPRYRYVSNVNAQYVSRPEEIRDLLVRQMFSPVRWKEVMDTLYRCESHHIWEMGPGTVLSKLFSREYPDVEVKNVNSWNRGRKEDEEERKR